MPILSLQVFLSFFPIFCSASISLDLMCKKKESKIKTACTNFSFVFMYSEQHREISKKYACVYTFISIRIVSVIYFLYLISFFLCSLFVYHLHICSQRLYASESICYLLPSLQLYNNFC